MTIEDALWQDPERCSGAVCFRGTRIMASILFDNLDYAGGFEAFLENYPDVTLEQVRTVLDYAQGAIDARFAQRIAA